MTPVTLYNAARWNLHMAHRAEKRSTKSETDRRANKREAERLRATAKQCLQRLKEMS
jgi:hypothetical protein